MLAREIGKFCKPFMLTSMAMLASEGWPIMYWARQVRCVLAIWAGVNPSVLSSTYRLDPECGKVSACAHAMVIQAPGALNEGGLSGRMVYDKRIVVVFK